jgi:hypothetical protein
MTTAEESVSALEANLPSDHWDLARARTVLGGSLVHQGRYEQAEGLLLQSQRVLTEQATVAKIRPHYIECLRVLVRLYDSWNKPEKAAEYRALLKEATGGDESEDEGENPASEAKTEPAKDSGEVPADPSGAEGSEGETP